MSRDVDACWGRIGVGGDRSCPELTQYVHCRNCPKYSNAARAVLDLPSVDEYLQTWTRHYAETTARQDAASASALIFRIGAEWLALPTQALDSVADMRPIHSVPHRRGGAMLGLVNVRGELLVCASLERLLGIGGGEHTAKDSKSQLVLERLLVIRQNDARFVLPVHEVHGIEHYAPRVLVPVPATVSQSASTYTLAMLPWRERSVGLINAQVLFLGLERGLA